jgi:putative effector of murein hydrolase LrgA (UPF0299 family)
VSKKAAPRRTSQEGDEAFVGWLARWAILTSLLLIVFDVAVLRNYPFPGFMDALRGPFYTVLGVALLFTSLGFGFLGFRVVTTRYQGRTRDIYMLFLPPVLLVTSLVWLLLLAAVG